MKQITRKEASHLQNKTSTCHPSAASSHPISNIISQNINSPWNQRFHALITARHCRDGCSREISGSSGDAASCAEDDHFSPHFLECIETVDQSNSCCEEKETSRKYDKEKKKKKKGRKKQVAAGFDVRSIDRKLQG